MRICPLYGELVWEVLTHREETSAIRDVLSHCHTGTRDRPCGLHLIIPRATTNTSGIAMGLVTYVSKCSSAPTPLQSASGSAACGKNPGKVSGPYHILLGSLIPLALVDTGDGASGWRSSIVGSERLTLATDASSVPQFQPQERQGAPRHALQS